MTREIKFRGIDKESGKWVYGNLFVRSDMYWIIEDNNENHGCMFAFNGDGRLEVSEAFEVIPESVGMFTGLHDKNGVEIYKGDIVGWYDSIPNIDWYGWVKGIVEYKQGGFFVEALKASCEFSNYIWCLGEFKVIGNIYENKDLLKK